MTKFLLNPNKCCGKYFLKIFIKIIWRNMIWYNSLNPFSIVVEETSFYVNNHWCKCQDEYPKK